MTGRHNVCGQVLQALGFMIGALTALGCDSARTKSVPNTKGTDRIWVSENTYCARLPNALVCWEAGKGNVTQREPTVFDGVGTVQSLVLRDGEGCAISNLGSGCFRIKENQFARGRPPVPDQLIAFGDEKRMHCMRYESGVSCFTDKIENIKPMPVFEKPRRIHASLRGEALCAELDYELRCFKVDKDGKLRATVRVRGVRDAQSVRINEEPGSVMVLDSTGIKTTGVKTDVMRGRPVTDDKPAEFPHTATVDLTVVDGVSGPKMLTADSTSIFVLDDTGVKAIKLTGESLEVHTWPLTFVPTALWQGRGGFFFVAHDGKLSMHGWKGNERYGRELRGVKNPKDVAAGEFFTCVVHDEGISCVENIVN